MIWHLHSKFLIGKLNDKKDKRERDTRVLVNDERKEKVSKLLKKYQGEEEKGNKSGKGKEAVIGRCAFVAFE